MLTRYFIVGGAALTDFGGVFHMEVLPYAYGFTAPEVGRRRVACCSPRRGSRSRLPPVRSAATSGRAQRPAPPSARPRCSTRSCGPQSPRRRWRSQWRAGRAAPLAAAVTAALLGLAALALFRHVPGIHPGWHTAGQSLDLFREYSWSRRILEYLPLAGLVGLAIRNRPAAMFFGWVLLTVIVFTLGRELTT